MNKNRYQTLSTPQSSVEENSGEKKEEFTNFHGLVFSSQLSINAPEFVPRSISVNSLQNNTELTNTNHNTDSLSRDDKNSSSSYSTKSSPGKEKSNFYSRGKEKSISADWTVVKPKVTTSNNFNGNKTKRNFVSPNLEDEKLPVRSSCSRQKALQAILARKRVLIILRGPPGSGKSFLAK